MANLKTPTEILQDNPKLKDYGWTANDIGSLVRVGLVSGRKLPFHRGTLADEKDVLKVFALCKPKPQHLAKAA